MINACNICGCSALSNSPGILPNFRTHFAGIRHSAKTTYIQHLPSLLQPVGQKSNESVNSTELWGRWYPLKRLQVFAFVPYNTIKRMTESETTVYSGFGDVSVLMNFVVLNTGDSFDKKLKQALLIGGGAKWNTAHFNAAESPGFQLGSGTRDLFLTISHTLRFASVGVQNEATLRMPGTNPLNYRFGNRSLWSAKAFYWFSRDKYSWMPHAGFAYEKADSDKLNAVQQARTGAEIYLAGAGVDVYFKSFNIGINCFKPLKQNINASQAREGFRLQFNLIYNFKQTSKCN